MESERLDLSAFDPAADRDRWERLIESIMARAAPELARRAIAQSPIAVLAGWARPMLAVAATLAAVSSTALMRATGAVAPAEPPPGVVEALEVPAPAASWLTEEREPSVDDLILILAVEGDPR